MKIVISQSMLFPWVGMLEQIRLADVFVRYDDVQFSKGSFTNRVQVKLPEGSRWMTVPLQGFHLGQSIDETGIAPPEKWKAQHVGLLRKSFDGAPFARDAIAIAENVYSQPHETIGSLAHASMMALAAYFGFADNRRFIDVGSLGIAGSSWDRVLRIVQALDGDRYITGHGAAAYLDHEAFDQAGISVEYMDYRKKPYPQAHGAFTPYVTGLDLVAHCGPEGLNSICSQSKPWRQFLHEPA